MKHGHRRFRLTRWAVAIGRRDGSNSAILIPEGAIIEVVAGPFNGVATGTITFTPANSCTNPWTIQSASTGIQEAWNAAAGGIVFVPPGISKDSAGFNDRSWLDGMGHPHSEDMRIQERFHRRDFGHMDLQVIVDDPKMYTKPIVIKVTEVLIPDSDVLETVCENEKDQSHFRK